MLIAAKPSPAQMPGTNNATRPPTTRKFKVKTGCITCRIRKVKCDEAKPFCNRCTGTGRKCDGYNRPDANKPTAKQQAAQRQQQKKTCSGQDKPATCNSLAVQAPSHSRSRSASAIPQVSITPPTHARSRSASDIEDPPTYNLLADATSITSILSGDERRWFQHFCERTAPAISGVFDNGFWTQALPQMGSSEPAVRHAMLAVSSLHSRFESGLGSVNNVLRRPGVPDHEFTIQQYNSAIACLQQRLALDSKAVQLPLVCCLLFICLECLYGNRSLALGHLQNGVKILNSARLSDGELHSKGDATTLKHKLYQNFLRLDAHSTFYGKPAAVSSEPSELLCSPLTPVAPTFLASFDDAKRSLDKLIACTMGFVKMAKASVESDTVTPSSYDFQLQLQEQYQAWLQGFNALLARRNSMNGTVHLSDPREYSLRMLHAASWIWLSTCLSETELIYDEYTTTFNSIISWAQELCKSSYPPANDINAQQTVFTLDMTIMPSLFLTAVKCRDPLLRRKAISILDSYLGCEGLWDAKLYAAVARRVVDIEEAGLVVYGDDMMPTAYPADHCRIRNADVKEDLSDENSRARKVRFHGRPNGPRGEKCLWYETVEF